MFAHLNNKRLQHLLERYTNTRGFRIAVLLIVISIFVAAFYFMKVENSIDRVENLLLDVRLQSRANSLALAPSENIVIVAKDLDTNMYARNHPEMNIPPQGPLPRKRVAQIIDYISKQKPRAIIMDVEMQDPSTPENDDAMEKAIANAGNVYLGIQFRENQLGNLGDQNLMKQPDFLPKTEKFILENDVLPVLDRYTKAFSYFFQKPHSLFSELNSTSLLAYYPNRTQGVESNISKAYDRMFTMYSQDALEQSYKIYNHIVPFSMMRIIQPFPQSSLESMDDMSRLVAPTMTQTFRAKAMHQCLEQKYETLFKNRPSFLTELARKNVPVLPLLSPEELADVNRKISYCRVEPIMERFMKPAKGLGVVNVEYFKEGFLRDVPLVYKGYEGKFFTYLGARPILDVLNVKQIAYTPNTLYLQKSATSPEKAASLTVDDLKQNSLKEINLFQHHNVLINWRNPENGKIRLNRKMIFENNYTVGPKVLALWAHQPGCPEIRYPKLWHTSSPEAFMELYFSDQCGEDCKASLMEMSTVKSASWAFPEALSKNCDRECMSEVMGLYAIESWLTPHQQFDLQQEMSWKPFWLDTYLLAYEGSGSSLAELRNELVESKLEWLDQWFNVVLEKIQFYLHIPSRMVTLDDGYDRKLFGKGGLYRNISAMDVILTSELSTKGDLSAQLPNSEGDSSSSPVSGPSATATEAPGKIPDSMSKYYGQPEMGAFSFKDKIIIYGDTTRDIHRTPVGEAINGPEIVATVTDMIWNDHDFIKKVDNEPLFLVVGLLCALILYSLFRENTTLWAGNAISLLIMTIYWGFNFLFFSVFALWVPLVWPTCTLLAVMLVSNIFRFWIQDMEKRQLTNVFANYVSPQVMNEILKSPEHAMENLKGRKKELTVLFSDIKNFTQTFENEDPEQMVEQLNEYFNLMFNIILKHGGTHDKYMGDAIMAFFGSPHPIYNHAEIACMTALEMQAALKDLNQKWRSEGKKELEHGIGLSTGLMFVGNFGSDRNTNYTVMGSLVNLGARLETYTREVDADIIISDNTVKAVGSEAKVRDLGKIQIKGFSELVQIFALDAWEFAPPSKEDVAERLPRKLPANPSK